MAQYDGSIRINTLLNTMGLRRGESEIRGSMGRISNAARKMAAVIASAFAVGKIVQFGKEALEAASDFEAMEAQFSQVFGELEDVAAKSLSSIAEQAGITEERMKSSYTKIAAFAKTTGMDTASSLKLSERAMVAVADSAAFYDRSLEETTEYLQSFLKGNYENDAALGLSATEFTRNAAANKLYGKSFIELSEAQKQLTLLQMVEDANKLSGAMGQAAREADTWTNQTGNLSQAWKNLKANLGKIILPGAIQAVKAITNVINSINAMIERLSVAAGAFRSFSELLTGNKSKAGSGAPSGGPADTSSEYNSSAEAAENLADSTEQVAQATKKAKKETEKYLSPLDEINRYSEKETKDDSSSSGAGTDGTVGTVDYGNLAEGETIIDGLNNSFQAVIEKAKELAGLFKKGFFEGLGDYKPRIEEIKKDIMSIGRTLKEIFTDPEVVSAADRFVSQLALTFGQNTGAMLSTGITMAQNLIGGIEKYLTQNTERIKQYIISMFDIGTEISAIIGNFSVAFADIFSVFGGDTAQQITANLIGIFAEVGMLISENAAKLGRDILNMITQPIIENKDKIKEALEGTLQAIEPLTSGLLTAVQTVRDAVADIYDNHLKPLFDSIATGLSEILGKLLDGYNEYIAPVLQNLGTKFQELMEGPFGETIEKIKDLIGTLIDALKLLWENILVPLFSWIADNIMPILAPIIEFIGNTVLNKISTIIKVVGDVAQALSGLITFIVGVFTGDWGKAWEGIQGLFSGIWNAMKDILSGKFEQIKNIIYLGIGVIQSIMDTLNSWLQGVFSKDWSKSFGAFGEVLNGFFKGFSDIWDSIKEIFGGIIKFIDGVFSGDWEKAWEGIKEILSGIWDGLVAIVKAPINAIIGFINGMIEGIVGGINSLIRLLNNFKIDIPANPFTDAVSIGFNFQELSVPKIPALATGAVIPPNKEFLAVLGDQKHGTNIEAPLSTIEEASERAVEKVLNRMWPQQAGSATYNFSAQINRRVLFDEIIDEAKLRQTINSRNPFELT